MMIIVNKNCIRCDGFKGAISHLERFNSVRFLCLENNGITKIENLDEMKRLGSLDLTKNQICKMENLNL
jgi:hypothetical protein